MDKEKVTVIKDDKATVYFPKKDKKIKKEDADPGDITAPKIMEPMFNEWYICNCCGAWECTFCYSTDCIFCWICNDTAGTGSMCWVASGCG